MLTRSPQEDIITPGASTVAKFKTLMWSFARFLLVSNRALVNAFYVLTLFPPIARLLPRKLFGLLCFQLGVGCLCIDIE